MKLLLQIVSLLSVLKCVRVEHVWHPYHHDPIHKNREEIVITNITSVEFKLDYVVSKWKSVHVEDTCYLAGTTETNIVVVVVKTNEKKNGFVHKSYEIDLGAKPVDVALFQYWNVTSQETEVMVVAVKHQSQLLWYRITTRPVLVWTWPMAKPIIHINAFQINHDYHLLVLDEYLNITSASLYEFLPNNPSEFWLRQVLPLSRPCYSSGSISVGPHTYLAIPQESLQVYKFQNRLVSFKNLTSPNITEVVTFKIGSKAFLAFNGLSAGIYRFSNSLDLLKESVLESHLHDVNYWLPIPLTIYGDDTILIAQRSISHGAHRSFFIEIFTYNGEKFEEHEDVKCYYFGEESGLSCLPDEDAQKGIKGSTSIFLGGILGVVIPRRKRPSDLFVMKTELKKIQNPLEEQIEEFVSKKRSFEGLLAIQENRYRELEARKVSEDPDKIRSDLDKMADDLKEMAEYMVKEEHPRYNIAVFNNVVTIQNSSSFQEVQAVKINSQITEDLLQDIVRKNNLQPINGIKTFPSLQTSHLTVGKINHVPSSGFLYSDQNVTFSADLFLTKPLKVSQDFEVGEVNGLVFQEEVIDPETPIDDLYFESLKVSGVSTGKLNDRNLTGDYEEFVIPRNLTVVKINGEEFNEFLKGLCFKNVPNYVPGKVTVVGDVKVLEDATIDTLNGLNFPDEFVFVDHSFPNITGIKNFTTLTTSEFTCDGTVDTIPSSHLITLSTDQEIPGTTTFKNLKITESLEVQGKITGEHASKFLPNPTLLETSTIKSNVQFQNLEVQGSIIILRDFNGNNLESQLTDVVYTTEEQPVIEAMKHFPEGFKTHDLIVGSKSINNVSLNAVVTKNTEQVLDFKTIMGDVSFEEVGTSGLYHWVDVRKLDEEMVKLEGEQYISSSLVFEEDVEVSRLEVVDSLKKLELDLDTKEVVDAKSVLVEGNLVGKIEGFDLDNFRNRRLSFEDNQTVWGGFNLKESQTEALEAATINRLPQEDFDPETWVQKLKGKLEEGELEVVDLHVKDSVEIDRINDEFCNFAGSFWSHDIQKHNLTNLTFQRDVSFNTVQINQLSGVNFWKFANNIVFKNETNVTISGKKTFVQGLTVRKLIETQSLNNVSLANILTRHGSQEVSTPLRVSGDVVFDLNTSVSETINEIPVRLLSESFQSLSGEFRVSQDVLFKRLAHINNLNIEGFVDHRKVDEVVEGLVYIDDDFGLKGLITFENRVEMDKNMRVKGRINSVDLPAFVSDMVMVTRDTTINSRVRFSEDVLVEKVVTLVNLTTMGLNGVDVRKWEDQAVFIDKGFLKGTYMFKDATIVDDLLTQQLNNITMETLIPLRTHQQLPELSFTEISVFKDVSVGNSTNFRDLPQEFLNSVFVDSNQEIQTAVEFDGNVFIEGDLELSGDLNGIQTNRVVTTNTDQKLEGVYKFKSKVNFENDLLVQGLINGVDVQKWGRDALRVSSQVVQNVTDSWNIDQDLIFVDDCFGNSTINGIDFQGFSREVKEKRNYKYELERGFIDDYNNICKDLTYMYGKINQQVFKFDYFETMQVVNFQRTVEFVYDYDYLGHNYLIVNERKDCQSHLFVYDTRWRFVGDVEMGHVAQIVSVRFEEFKYLVVRNGVGYSSCRVDGSKVWQVKERSFMGVSIIDPQDLLQESLEPGTFYGLRDNTITEFKLSPNLDTIIQKYRKWKINEENIAFIPRGLATGLALRTGRKLIKLHRDSPVVDDFSLETETTIIGNYTSEFNPFFPGRDGGDLVVLNAGIRSNKRRLLAVASHEETRVKGSLDFIKIYEDVISGRIFHKVPTYKPSSLLSLEFHNGETLLAFLEDGSTLQMFEYKGIEGFKHKLSVKLDGSKLFTFTLERKRVVGVVDNKKITFMEVVMMGNQIEENLQCEL